MKSAKVLVGLVVCVAVLAGAIVSGWRVFASPVGVAQQVVVASVATVAPAAALPAGQPSDPTWWQTASDQLATQWQQADHAKASMQPADAAQQYLAIADQLPESRQSMDALLKAAACRRQANPNADVIGLYDRVINIGNKYINIDYSNTKQFGWDQTQFKQDLKAMKSLLYDAMCGKAQAYYDAGNSVEAKRTLDAIRAEFSNGESSHRDRVYPLEAKLTGEDATAIYNREKAASGLFDQAYADFRRYDHDKAISLANSILTDYPQTAAVLRAMDLKARNLYISRHREEAVAIYREILERLKDVAPDAEFARIASARIALHDSVLLYFRLEKQSSKGEVASSVEWQRLRDICRESNRVKGELAETILSHKIIVASYFFEGQYAQAVQEADDTLRDYYYNKTCMEKGVPKAASEMGHIKAICAGFHFWAGRALAKMGRCQEAKARFDLVLQSINNT